MRGKRRSYLCDSLREPADVVITAGWVPLRERIDLLLESSIPQLVILEEGERMNLDMRCDDELLTSKADAGMRERSEREDALRRSDIETDLRLDARQLGDVHLLLLKRKDARVYLADVSRRRIDGDRLAGAELLHGTEGPDDGRDAELARR